MVGGAGIPWRVWRIELINFYERDSMRILDTDEMTLKPIKSIPSSFLVSFGHNPNLVTSTWTRHNPFLGLD